MGMPGIRSHPECLKNSKCGQSIQLHSHVSEVESIFQTKENYKHINGKIMTKMAK